MMDLFKMLVGFFALLGLCIASVNLTQPSEKQAIAQPPAAACSCVNCLTDSDVRRIVAEELAKQSPKEPTAPTAPLVPAKAASADPLIGKKNSDGSVTIAVQYDVPAPAKPKVKLPPIRKPPMPFGGTVQAGQAVVGGAVKGTCRIVNGVRICN